jgi:hypothetical protein
MTLRWWTRLALISAIAGFVASGPPSDFERSDVESPARLSNDFATTLPVIETFETTELATTEVVSDPSQASDFISPPTEGDPSPATAP